MISVILPAYNEKEAIGQTLDDIKSVMDRTKQAYEVVVVDDGSSDGTKEIVKKRVWARLIEHPYNRGYGAALKTGMLKSSGEWIVITDADGTYPVKDIPELLRYAKDYDMVVGARTKKNVHIPFMRRPAKFIISRVANYIAGERIADLNSGMRLFKRENAMRFFHLYPERFSFTITITLAHLCSGYSVKYVPIEYYKRIGKSSIKKRDFINFNHLMLRMIMYFRPLKFFMPVAAVTFLAGLSFLAYDLVVKFNINDASVFLILTSLLIGFMGLMADMIAKKTGT